MFKNHLNEETLEFRFPDWAYAGIVLTLMLTLLAAIYIVFGSVMAIAYLVTFIASMALWNRTTFQTRKMRRIIPYVVLTLLFLLIQNIELWSFDFPAKWVQSALGADAPAFDMKSFMGFYFFGIIGFGLLSVSFTFFHNHFGNFLSWFILIHGIAFSLVCVGGLVSSQPLSYFPGLLSAIPLLVVCIGGVRFILNNHRG
jgi:hypothetical protein